MNIQSYIEQKKEVYSSLMRFIESDDDIEESFNNLETIIENQKLLDNQLELRNFLHLIAKISNNHHRTPDFFNKIEQILDCLKSAIAKYYTNNEIFLIFKSNKRILLFIIESKIIAVDKSIIYNMTSQKYIKMKYPHYFLPEIKQFFHKKFGKGCDKKIISDYIKKEFNDNEEEEDDDEDDEKFILIDEIEKELPINFYEKRLKGESDDFIGEIIQNDSIEEFIIYIDKNSYPLSSTIKTSIYETNYFLLKENPSLIEYAAFYGSSQIFNYLYKNGVPIESSLWKYAIHSDDPQMIHLLEKNDKNYSFEKCFIESIKCHHNDVANYIKMNYSNDQQDIESNENILSKIIRYYNYLYFPSDVNNTNIFLYACGYDYIKLVKLYLATCKINISTTVVLNIFF